MSCVSPPVWFDREERLLPAHHHAALLLDLLLARDLNSHKVLRGTGLFQDDMLSGQGRLSPRQLLQLIANARKLDRDDELAFRWGAQYWPGHYGPFSTLLANAANLGDALRVLCKYPRFLSPLLTPCWLLDERYCYLYWIDSHGAGADLEFLVATHMAATVSMCRWLSGERLPWHFVFAGKRPADESSCQVYLGEQRHYGMGINLMLIERCYLERAWPKHSAIAWRVTEPECQQLALQQPQQGLPEAVYRYLVSEIRQPLVLPDVATHFAMSPATFKRKLGKNQCHFQQLQDQARLHVGLYLLHVKGWNNEQVAQHLCFNDTTNFRRAFKRWCGLTPSDSRALLALSELPDGTQRVIGQLF
jgi:AraC-like DNA-binding protein